MTNLDFTLIESLILDYANIRKKTEMYKKRFPKYITGNDNYIGMIGEYWATKFLEDEKLFPQKKEAIKSFIAKKEEGEHNLSNEWSDFELKSDNQTEYVSVKTIFENKNGESGTIKFKDFKDDEIGSVMIIKLNDSLFPTDILYIEDVNNNLKNIGERHYLDNWLKGSLAFKYYDNSTNRGFDKELSKFIYKYDSATEQFKK